MVPGQDDIEAACQALARVDSALARAYAMHGAPAWRSQPHGYRTLARSIAYQQISTKAAASIWQRFEDMVDGDVCPDRVLGADHETLRSCGLSRPKISHLTSIAEAVADGRLCFDRLASASNDDARAELIAIKGIGPWTADIYLMSSLGRMDAYPTSDLGLIEAYRMLRDDAERFPPKAFNQRAEAWRPHRAVAAHLLWGHINAVREEARGGLGGS